MKKITQLEFGAMTHQQTWNHINSLQSELEALEGRKGQGGMTVEEIEEWLQGPNPARVIGPGRKLLDSLGKGWRPVAEVIQPLTVPQGFVPDWSKAPEWARSVKIQWSKIDEKCGDDAFLIQYIPRPIPPKVTRERTDLELVNLCFDLFGSWETVVKAIVREGSLKALCTAAGIPTTTEEV